MTRTAPRTDAVGRVVVLNGTSSAGKTTLVRALQDRWDGLLLDAGLDRHLTMLPRRYLGADWPEIFFYDHAPDGSVAAVRPGPSGDRLVRAMHRCAPALARAGMDVVVDHVLLDHAWALDLSEALDGVPATVVGVRCPVDVLVGREQRRADRTVGQAAAQLPVVHSHGGYDLDVDTSVLSPQEAARDVAAAVDAGGGSGTLDRWRTEGTSRT